MKNFEYAGYSIPHKLVMLTGGGTDDWKEISDYHEESYRKYTPIKPNHTVLEIGSGVGRDAIVFSKYLSSKGRYIGIDIIKPSIEWCQENITPKHKNFTFHYYDIESHIHNAEGKITTRDIILPAESNSVDRIVLNSVFTHMFEKDIIHYLKEFSRVLKDDGLVLASFFVIDDNALNAVRNGKRKLGRHPLSFKFKKGRGCYINDEQYPEGAVAFTPKRIQKILKKGNMSLEGKIHRGVWSGFADTENGQDILILKKKRNKEPKEQSKRIDFTND